MGLSLACAAAEAGFSVRAIDVDSDRIDELQRGILSVPGVNDKAFQSALATGRIEFTTDADELSDSHVILICVPTPVRDHTPDLSYVERSAKDVALRITRGQLVILESTTYPGTTEELVLPILETSGLQVGRDFLLAYSPERIDPGNDQYGFRDIPRIVGGVTREATGVTGLFYAQLLDRVFAVSSCRTAELAKLLENTFRHVNIALVNEMSMLCHEVGIDVWEVIEAAATKPFGFMPFFPGPGVGGHCIPLDPTYLAWQVRRDAGRHFRILEQAQDINAQMPSYVASRISEALNECQKPVRGANILLLGIAYKQDVGDIRESPAIDIMKILTKKGAQVSFHDPYVPSVSINGGLMTCTPLTHRAVTRADCVAILSPHRSYDLDWIAERASLVFDARNAYGSGHRTGVVRL